MKCEHKIPFTCHRSKIRRIPNTPSDRTSLPCLQEGRKAQDKQCFGLFVFIVTLFMVQSISAIFSANYELPHNFAECEKRVQVCVHAYWDNIAVVFASM